MAAVATIEGAGPARVLVLHGWALDSTVWAMSRSFTDLARFTYAYLDFPGYGAASKEAPAAGLDEMARDALAAAGELGWDRFSVLGHSMGGAAAIRLATLAPDRVQGVVALTPVAAGGTPLPQDTYAGFDASFPTPAPVLQPLAPNLTDRQVANLVARCHQTMDQATWSAYLKNWTGADFVKELGAFPGPVRICYGADDGLVNAAYLEETVTGLARADLVRLEGAGHYPMLEQPEASVAQWEDALRHP
ncbi:alpha/beta fold hydrolase [Amycolatopsis sp. VS8301801F10]|uniref:alpha/beta fold hydrolase n=1 Tax=Amycolatopsis sp. VS8301801F10 TaxID=2652442 RepID=UPI0038FC2360